MSGLGFPGLRDRCVVVKVESFKAFGEQLTSTGSFVNTHRFTGKEFENSGIYYFGARYYDPWLGRFLTPDPLGKFEPKDPKTINPYIYCTDNPTRYVDPTGKWRTYVEDGIRYAYREPPIDALIRTVGSFASGYELAECIIRSAQGDITLSTSDWIWAVVDIALPIASEFAKSTGLKQSIKDIQKAGYAYGAYEAASEYEKAKDLDPEIFAKFSAATGIKEQPFGVVSGKHKIVLGKGNEESENLRKLQAISDAVYNERHKSKPRLNLNPSDYWNYNVH